MMTYTEFVSRLGFVPNEQKEAAIRAVEGKTLLLAVPGSGKTTALVARLGYMVLCCGISPESILTMTYTVAAASEMKARFASMFGEELASRLEFRTINAVCNGIVGYYSKNISGKFFRLADDGQSGSVLPRIYREITGEYPTESDLKDVRTAITYCKNMMLSDGDVAGKTDIALGKFPEIYTAYRKTMRENGLMDFDDQLIYAYNILKKVPPVLEYYRKKYRYICVDEAQDTSLIQHRIIALLTGENGNLFMVGDEDQSIYGFRAAYPRALTGFKKIYPEGNVLFMEDNYRSAAEIVGSADGFVRGNKDRYPKLMHAACDTAGGIIDVKVDTRGSQYTELLKAAKNCRVKTAVLYRENECALPLIDLLERNGVDYALKASDFVFFSHRIVRDIVSVLKLAMNGYDRDAYMQVFGRISPFLKKAQAEEVCRISEAENIPVYEAVLKLGDLEPRRLGHARMDAKLLKAMAKASPANAIESILGNLGYKSSLERQKIFSSKPDILLAIARHEQTVGAFLWRLEELERIVKKKASEPSDGKLFTLSTVHMAKGLEYEDVWLMDVTDDVIPGHSVLRDYLHNSESRAVYEEERRIFYVAVTRAKKRLFILSPRDAGAKFANELRECRLKVITAAKDSSVTGENAALPGNTVSGSALKLGMRVRHIRFGEGTVTGRTDKKVSVAFDNGEYREYIASVVKFELI
ncbi:MAG: ATP-dependent helicase [Clostridia bacterium]|nr:ATP-dependent helicase [Clostridia bacterium]